MSRDTRPSPRIGAWRPLCAAALAIAVAEASAADAKVFVEVGEIPVDCPITIRTNLSINLPSTWKISPQRAVELAAAAGEARCASKLGQAVFVDADNYYIVKTVLGPMSEASHAVKVNGVTGVVSVQN